MALSMMVIGCRCDDSEPDEVLQRREPVAAAGESTATTAAGGALSQGTPQPPSAPDDSAELAFEAALARPGLDGDPSFERARATLLSRAKNQPIYFVQAPEPAEASGEIDYYRHRIQSARSPWTTLQQLLPYFSQHPDKGRQVLLFSGYLYATDPDVAFSLVGLVSAHHLFDDEHIWIQRGEELLHARRDDRKYLFSDGPEEGEPVRLLLLDRVGAGREPATRSLHVDFQALRGQLAFDRVRVEHVTENHLVVDLRYGGEHWVRSLLRRRGPHLELQHESVEPKQKDALARARREAQLRREGIELLRATIDEQVEENLPFDEPKTEVGQEDGKLRRSWRYAYEQGWQGYHVRGDRYRVFDQRGRPRVPQVCVDFLLDTFERAGGTWYNPRSAPRERASGTVDFEGLLSRNELRRAKTFIEFSQAHPEWFEVMHVPQRERIALGYKERFFEYLAVHADEYQAGDMVFIRGKTPWDEREEHTHSFFIYETDPVTGVPISIAGNANTPAIWSLEVEARRTPLRTLRYRIRPTTELLERVRRGQK